MRSDSPRVSTLAGATLGLAALLLTACGTTQQEAARLRLNSSRLRAAELRVEVTRSNPAVRVEHVTLFTGRSGTAVAVRVHNLGATATSDLPISVRTELAPRRTAALNGGPSLDYFETHLPAILARGRLTWVFTTGRRLPPGARVSALVGLPQSLSQVLPRTLPSLQITPASGSRGELRVTVRNPTSVPQYQLQVYGLANERGRLVAAGRATIAHLGTNATTTLRLKLLGTRPGTATTGAVSFELPPTIFG